MILKDSIEDIYEKKTNYTYPEQVMDQSNLLETVSSDIYTDPKRFIYELLQNADDSSIENSKNQVSIKITNNYLVFAHNGKVFSNRDIEGLCSVNYGTKTDDKTKTGYKGIGFKSVFGQSEEVTIYTNNEYFRFDKKHKIEWKTKWANSQEEWEKENERLFISPWQLIPIYTEKDFLNNDVSTFLTQEKVNVATILNITDIATLKEELSEFIENINIFIFLRNINKINISIDNETVIEIDNISNNEIVLKKNSIVQSSWLIKKVELDVDIKMQEEIKFEKNIPDKLKKADKIELTLCAKKDKDGINKITEDESLIYSYLPTSTRLNIPVLVNTTFILGANREYLHKDSLWNKWLFSNISYKLIEWISELVTTKYSFQAYKLFPTELNSEYSFNSEYNKGIDNAIENIPLLLSSEQKLLKIKDSIYDEVNFSNQTFISKYLVKNFVLNKKNKDNNIDYCPFITSTGVEHIFNKIGLMEFKWEDVSSFLNHPNFVEEHKISDNIELIKFLKTTKLPERINNKTLKNWPFVMDHHEQLKIPTDILLPLVDDDNWQAETELSYLHNDLKDFISLNNDYKKWLGKLGIKEKTEMSYIETKILPDIENYITSDNAIKQTKDFYDLFTQDKLTQELFSKLSNMKVLTTKGTKIPISNCYFSNCFNPELEIEALLEKDIFLNENYLFKNEDKDEIKRFFKKLGVKQDIQPLIIKTRINKDNLILERNLKEDYFSTPDKYFQPFQTNFNAREYSKLIVIEYMNYSSIYDFSLSYWNHIIGKYKVCDIDSSAKAYWGNAGHPGWISGDNVENYIKWFVKNIECIPTQTKKCLKSTEVFLNTENILTIGEGYLPIVDIEKLTADWKSFFNFKTALKFNDYLEVFSIILQDITPDNKLKKDNLEKVINIYKYFLDNCLNWGESEIELIKGIFDSSLIPDINLTVILSNELKYTNEEDTSIFENDYKFIYFSKENQSHLNFKRFLEIIGIVILTDKDFQIEKIGEKQESSLKNKLLFILPYLNNWLSNKDEFFDIKKQELLTSQISKIEIYEFEKLQTTNKSIKIYFEDNILNIAKTWETNSIQIELFTKLSNYLNIKGHEDKLRFLLTSEIDEIDEDFKEQEIDIPIINISNRQIKEASKNNLDLLEIDSPESLASFGITSLKDFEMAKAKSPNLFHHITPTPEMFIASQKLIRRAMQNIKEYLKTLPEYNCEDIGQTAPTTLGGIIKNGSLISIITRPSDDDQIVIYYESEKDVLEDATNELWYEKANTEPKKMTLGKLLKQTEITRIPV